MFYKLWRTGRYWYFRKFQFRPDRMYGSWGACSDHLSVGDLREVWRRDVELCIPKEYRDRVQYVYSEPICNDPLCQYGICGWKYVPEARRKP
jgi:hypothetical protein